jgi:hypothetical protein
MTSNIWFPVCPRESVGSTEGVDIVVTVLKAVRAKRGRKATTRIAEEMITAAAAIVARESGPERAREVLDLAGRTLPARR